MLLAGFLIRCLAYLLGSIPTGYLLVRLFRHEDIRSVGSGNIGATNVLRSGGKGLGAATFLLDVLKGAAAVWLGRGWHRILLRRPMCLRATRRLSLPSSAVLGHMFPVWLHFRGGKGVATGFGVFLVAAPLGCAVLPSRSSSSFCCSAATFRWHRFLARPAFPSSRGSWSAEISPRSSSPRKSSLPC